MWSKGIGYTREPHSNDYISIYFVIYIVVCAFFIINLFVGIVITTYNRQKEQVGKDFMLTEDQKKWLDAKMLIIEANPKFYMKRPKKKWRQPFYDLVEDRRFEKFIMACISLNTLILCLKWYDQSHLPVVINNILNFIFAAIFTLELVFKLIAYDKRFFKDNWNIFDGFIVLGTGIGILLTNFANIDMGTSTLVIRAFRIGRIFKLFRHLKSLNIIFQTLLISLPAMTNVGGLLLLLLYIYSIVAMFLFAEIKDNYPLNGNIKFDSIGYSLLTMFRASTGENWHEVMHAVSRKNHLLYKCSDNPTYQMYVENGHKAVGCGDKFTSILFFVSFCIIVVLVFLNLFVAIILEGFEETYQKDKKLFNQETTEYFRDVWSRFDPNATGFIKTKNFPNLMFALGAPIGWDPQYREDRKIQKLFIKNLKLQTYNNYSKFQFINVLENLALNMIVKKEVEWMMRKM